jgi:16S rRNA (guanine527-N7)-methyltransferase
VDSGYGPEAFLRDTGVSRETLYRLKIYAEMLRHWQRRMNLVSPGTLEDLWRRHFFDSAQIISLIPSRARTIYDIGSGAGFPGLILAIMGCGGVTLFEADRKKCVFLKEVVRATAAGAVVRNQRMEPHGRGQRGPRHADVIVGRAVAPLDKFLGLVFGMVTSSTNCILLKGAQVENEILAASRHWRMQIERFPSASDPGGTILRLREISRETPH